MMSLSKLRPKDAVHAMPRITMANQGAPSLSLLAKIFGRWPSSAIATGRREYDITSELKVPNSLIMAAPTSAAPSHGPTTMDAMLAQLPVDQISDCTCRCQTARTGMTYEKKIAASASSITRGYVFCGFSTSFATVEALSHPM